MNATIAHELNPLPMNIEAQLQDLESRHKRHEAMLEWHKLRKTIRRERHRQGFHKMKPTAQVLP